MKKILYMMVMALTLVLTACDNDLAYPPVLMGDIKGTGTAADPYNVAMAVRVAAQNGETSDQFVFTKGVVCSGSIDTSYGNATWDIYDNAEGTGQKLIVYRAKDFDNKKFTNANKVAIGDTIVVYAPLINFRGNTPETGSGAYLYSINGMVGSDIPDTPDTPGVTIEPAGEGTINSPYNVAKAIQVAKSNGETSELSVYTEGYVISGEIDTQYGNGTWVISDNAEGTASTITVYRAKDIDNKKFTDTGKVKKGDKIVVYAPIINFKGNTPETNLGYLYSINGQTGSSTPDTPVTPPGPTTGDGDGSEASPYTVSQVQGGATGSSAWVKGYIVGWVDGQVLASGAKFNKDATVKTNLLLADSPDVTDVSQCIPVQLPSGDVRSSLNLQDNPGNYKKEVALCGSLEKYFGTAGLKSVSAYKLDGNGGGTPDIPDTPGTGDKVTYRAVDKVTSGKQYLIVAGDKAATPLTSAYGYIKVIDVTVSDGAVEAAESEAFTFTASGDGYTIKADGKYYYQTGTYNSFNVDATLPDDGGIWTVDIKDGAAVITNVSTSKTVQFDSQYTSFGCYPDVRGTYPVLYEKVEQ